MTTFSVDVARRFELQDVVHVAQLCLNDVEVTTKEQDPVVLHTYATTLMVLDKHGLSPETRNLIRTYLPRIPMLWQGAIAIFNGRFATLAPLTSPPVHLDITALREIQDPILSGWRPVVSMVVHLGEIHRVCKEALSGNGNVP